MVVGIERNVNPVGAGAELVHQRRADGPDFIHRQKLAMPVAHVAFVRKTVAVGGRRLIPLVALDRVIEIQAMVGAQQVAEIDGALLDIHGRRRRSHKRRCAGVGHRNQGQQFLNDGVAGRGGLRSLRRGQNCRAERNRLALPQSFIAQIDEQLVLLDRAAAVAAELVADKLGLWAGN